MGGRGRCSPIPPTSKEPVFHSQVPHPQYVTRHTWGLHRACTGLPPARFWRCGRTAADAQADGGIGSALAAICYAKSQVGSARTVISDSHQINQGDKRLYTPGSTEAMTENSERFAALAQA